MPNSDSTITRAVQVTASARLHLGFIDLNGELGRHFGSIGVAVTGLDAVVTATPSPAVGAEGHDAARAVRSAELGLAAVGETRGAALVIERAPPSHVGLGSGTQLGLAAAVACARLYRHEITPRDLAPAIGRGLRSGIGIAAFEGGGFIVDGGRTDRNRTAPILSRLDFPAEWSVVLIFDNDHQGLHGSAERDAFSRLPRMPSSVAADISRWSLVGLLPAVADRDYPEFVAAVSAVQARIGAHFAPAQGGAVFISPRIAAVVARLRQRFGDIGAGQSSWGPTAFAFAPNTEAAEAMKATGDSFVNEYSGLRLQIVSGCNQGARIEVRD
jgi:beta-ribofuranosylaminobenzene 5'-phosphate synthase